MDIPPEEGKPSRDFTIVFRRAPDYKLYPAPIIYGGLLPDGKGILMNVCIDHFAFPSYTTHETDSDGRVNVTQSKDEVAQGEVERELLSGIYLTIDQAELLKVWLEQHINRSKGL